MMSEAEEMLMATRANDSNVKIRSQSEDVVADVEATTTVIHPSSVQNVPLPAHAPASTAAWTTSHGAPSQPQAAATKQRHTRASTSDSRKGDLRVSSSIVTMSSISVSRCLQ